MFRFDKSPSVMRLLFVTSSLILLVPTLAGQNRVDLGQIPVRLELEKNFQQAQINSPTTITVLVKNSHGATVPAIKQETVRLRYEGQAFVFTILPGQSSADFHVTPQNAGIQKIEVTSDDLGGATGFMQCMDSKVPLRRLMISTLPALKTSTPPNLARKFPIVGAVRNPQIDRSPASTAGQGSTPAPLPPPPPPPAAPSTAAPVAATLKILALPDQVTQDAETGTWKTQVVLALMGQNDELIAADQDLSLHLSADKGFFNQQKVIPVIIKKDQPSTFDSPVTLSSDQPGTDVVHALSSMPEVQQTVVYQNPQPAGLRLDANPPSVINDGKSEMQIVVMLQDKAKHMIKATAETAVMLHTSRGTIDPAVVKIPAGQSYALATLTAAQHGDVTVNATADPLSSAQVVASFLFPWMMIIMASIGGLLGAFTHNPRAAVSAHWWRVLVVGTIFGVIFSIAALLGVISSLPKLDLPVNITQIPSTNELGALLLGFVGGFLGKKLWLKGGGEQDEEAKEKAAVKTA